MLVLSRKPSESIQIGDNIKLTIVRIGSNTVQIGIDAPKDVSILRSELVPSTIETKSCGTCSTCCSVSCVR